MEQDLRQLLQPGERAVGNWISIGHPAVAEICAHGFDFVIIDTEHAPIGLETVENMIRAIDEDVAPIVRVSENDPTRIKRILDTGVRGLMIPMVETSEQAKRAVEAMQYPPEGVRGAAPARASDYGRSFDEYYQSANEDLITIVQIETERGAENVEEIVTVDGVDAVIVGQGDLSASINAFGEWESDRFQSVLRSIVQSTHAADKPVGMLALDDKDIHRWIGADVDFLISGADIVYLVEGSVESRNEFKTTVESHQAEK